MGAENMEEADEFDRVIQSVAEGNYHPSAEMETFPVTNYNCWDIVNCRLFFHELNVCCHSLK